MGLLKKALSAVAVATTAAALVASGTAYAASHSHAIAGGSYAGNASVKSSPDVEFTIHSANAVPNLTLACDPKDPALAQGSGAEFVLIRAPKLHISNSGKLTYEGATKATANSGGANVVAATLKLNLHHVTGPTVHFTYKGRHLTTTVAWKGSVSSPVCDTLPNHGQVTLVGKVTEK